MNIPEEVQQFKILVSEFCAWAEPPIKAEGDELYQALRYASALHYFALTMPYAECESTYNPPTIDKIQCRHIYERFGSLPVNYYFEVFEPVTNQADEPVTGDAADDFLDMYVDLKGGLLLYEQGQIQNAVFHWKFTFGVHWGRHATSALRVLHCYWTKQ